MRRIVPSGHLVNSWSRWDLNLAHLDSQTLWTLACKVRFSISSTVAFRTIWTNSGHMAGLPFASNGLPKEPQTLSISLEGTLLCAGRVIQTLLQTFGERGQQDRVHVWGAVATEWNLYYDIFCLDGLRAARLNKGYAKTTTTKPPHLFFMFLPRLFFLIWQRNNIYKILSLAKQSECRSCTQLIGGKGPSTVFLLLPPQYLLFLYPAVIFHAVSSANILISCPGVDGGL